MWMHLLQLCDVVNEHTLCCRQPHKSAMRMTLLRKDGKPKLAWNREMQNNVRCAATCIGTRTSEGPVIIG